MPHTRQVAVVHRLVDATAATRAARICGVYLVAVYPPEGDDQLFQPSKRRYCFEKRNHRGEHRFDEFGLVP